MGIFKKQQNNMCKWTIPRKVQDIIPVMRIYDDGIFEIEKGKFSKTYKFTDINFAVASEDDKNRQNNKVSLTIYLLNCTVNYILLIIIKLQIKNRRCESEKSSFFIACRKLFRRA